MKALLVVDVQKDFCPGGSLAIDAGDSIVPIINRLIPCFSFVVATRDWHPNGHCSFASSHVNALVGDVVTVSGLPQRLWPEHCIAGSEGAQFAEGLETEGFDCVVDKGTAKEIDSYSGFYDNGRIQSTGLGDCLRARRVSDVYLCGLATDYCVKFTALDGVREGFQINLIEDASRGVDLNRGDVDAALEEMRAKGVVVMRSAELVQANGCRN